MGPVRRFLAWASLLIGHGPVVYAHCTSRVLLRLSSQGWCCARRIPQFSLTARLALQLRHWPAYSPLSNESIVSTASQRAWRQSYSSSLQLRQRELMPPFRSSI